MSRTIGWSIKVCDKDLGYDASSSHFDKSAIILAQRCRTIVSRHHEINSTTWISSEISSGFGSQARCLFVEWNRSSLERSTSIICWSQSCKRYYLYPVPDCGTGNTVVSFGVVQVLKVEAEQHTGHAISQSSDSGRYSPWTLLEERTLLEWGLSMFAYITQNGIIIHAQTSWLRDAYI